MIMTITFIKAIMSITAIMIIREIIFVSETMFQFGKADLISGNRVGIRESVEFPGNL
jgi:hypothetical protein